ncbi:hypothetical protein NDU88_003478 [Pleurodeles waltl]|uniref:Uncharacterized protein n=1 Tax=Pleurodeles waltl TaxID=8319 RepID=A0AAV7W647_PLEWA|nr:hypothetical protein NDU88_003478 [Pleurodeles waltl]
MEMWHLTNEEPVGIMEQASHHYFVENGELVQSCVVLGGAYKATIRGILIAGEVEDRRKWLQRLTTLESELLTLERGYADSQTPEWRRAVADKKEEYHLVAHDEVKNNKPSETEMPKSSQK